MTDNQNEEEKNSNNILNKNKNENETDILLQKLNNQLAANKKSILSLPSYCIDLDLDLEIDIPQEKKEIKKEENKNNENNLINNDENIVNKKDEIKLNNVLENKEKEKIINNNDDTEKKEDEININNNQENQDNKDNIDSIINVEDLNDDNISRYEEEKKENKNENSDLKEQKENKEINNIIVSNNNNNSSGEINNNNNEQKNSEDNINNNINKNNKDIKQNKKENEDIKKEEIDSNFELLNSDEEENQKEKENNLNNNQNNINISNTNEEKNQEKIDEVKNPENNEEKNTNLKNPEILEKNKKEVETNKKNSDSEYEDFDDPVGDEFGQGDFQNENNTNNNNINKNEENKEKNDISKENPNQIKEDNNPNINSNNNINDIIVVNETKEEDKIKLKNENNDINISSDIDISEKQAEAEEPKKSDKSIKTDKSEKNSIHLESFVNPLEIQAQKYNSVNNNKSENIIDNIKKSKMPKSFNNLPEEQKQSLEMSLAKVINFRSQIMEFNKADIDKYPVINLDFNYKEKSLDDLIPSLTKIIEDNETSEDAEKRKNDFLEHKYYEGIISTNPLLELIPECKISHMDLIDKIYEEQGLKNIPKITEENYQENIGKINNNNCKIFEVESLENFLYKYHLENNEEIILKSFKYFPYWRSIEGDGNSFYRTIMFSIIEYFIFKNSVDSLKKLISEISCDRFVEIYKEYKINYELAFDIFGTILYLLEEDKIKKAYSLFLKSYSLKDDSFDKVLIIYLRNICFYYVDEALELSKDEEVQKKFESPIVPSSINKELIKTMNIEPDFFVVSLMAYLFDININIYWIDRNLTEPKEGLIKFTDEDIPDLINISLGFFFSSYHRIYTRQFFEEEPLIQEIYNNELTDIKKLTSELKCAKKCNNCKENNYIIFLEKKIKVCKNCLDDYINEISNSRREALIKDNYIGKEYYSRPMRLNDNYKLNDYEFIEIKEDCNMINYLQQKLSVMCSNCKNFFTKRNLNNLKCKCLLCDKCLNEMIIQITDGKKILNKYEKINLGKMLCSVCHCSFSYEDAIDHLKDIKESDKDNAIKRMIEYASTLCLICGEKVREKKENISQNNINENNNNKNESDDNDNSKYMEIQKYKIINLKREGERNKGIDYIDNEHVICMECYEKNKIKKVLNSSMSSDEDNNEDKFFINFDKGICFCRICYKKHILLQKVVKNGGCCTTSFCSTY